ncbi:HAMP domain-containing histidine kinase [Rhizobium sp. S95]|uniref:histidine kinase n=1 Tax=Ciceribacter sichuanensis TaxID=2949647 RepID=A0AAJ1BXA6_9HYPH|nr:MULTISPECIES: HAMP domain-containing sensor histidine kinase [unclassified Ciceribacter]MCM2396994.1 HAMP domain-containing histidine kinase [Ciceribacter sp. S95]MCO5957914.1 HAMP domain-containing histidine kinase [Ciceribacter sp. S101]
MIQSLRIRLAVGAMVAIVFILLLVGFGLSRVFSNYVAERYRVECATIIDQLAAALELRDGKAVLEKTPSDPRFNLPGSGRYWQITPATGAALRSRSLWDVELPADLPRADHGFMAAEGPDGAGLLVYRRQIALDDEGGSHSFMLSAAFDRNELDDAVAQFHSTMALMLVLTAAVLVAAAIFQVGVGLSPLVRLQQRVGLVRSGQANSVEDVGASELRPLVSELNLLLTERETAVERARARASDLAHGLKTPLTVLLQLTDHLPPAQKKLARQQVDLVRQRADRQLQSARLGVEQMARTDLAPLVGKLVSVLKPVTQSRDVDWEIHIVERLTADMDAADLAEALGNVLDNAARYARGRIHIAAIVADGAIVITVEDDGPGIALHELATLPSRGRHLGADDEGSGLGLSITAEILAAYAGAMELEGSRLGGLAVRLRVPLRT